MTLDPAVVARLRCPCPERSRLTGHDVMECLSDDCRIGRPAKFPAINGKPALINFSNSVVSADALTGSGGSSSVKRAGSGLTARISSLIFGKPKATAKNLERLFRLVDANHPGGLILVLGSGTDEDVVFTSVQGPLVLRTDIYDAPGVSILCDAHNIPLADGSVQGVVVQSVLEHVLEPAAVVSEIYRVLGSDGLVYAETPFMQQVHEGPYDFTRYTHSGHRWLFRRFTEVEAGALKGPGTALLWTLRYILGAFIGDRRLAALLCAPLAWIRLLDSVLPTRHSIDAASEFFFLGRKAASSLTPEDIISYYAGAQVRQR